MQDTLKFTGLSHEGSHTMQWNDYFWLKTYTLIYSYYKTPPTFSVFLQILKWLYWVLLSFDSVVPDILLTLSAQRPTCSWKPWQNSLLQLIKSLFFFPIPSVMYDFTVPHLDDVSLLTYYHTKGSVKLAVITHDTWYIWVICIYEKQENYNDILIMRSCGKSVGWHQSSLNLYRKLHF